MIDNDETVRSISREELLPTLSTVRSMLRVLYGSATFRRAKFLNDHHNIEAHIFVRMTEPSMLAQATFPKACLHPLIL